MTAVARADNECGESFEEGSVSDRVGSGFDVIEIRALQAVLLGGGAAMSAADALGAAGIYAHMMWRRRSGSLARLPRA
jgi:hypothetical protein